MIFPIVLLTIHWQIINDLFVDIISKHPFFATVFIRNMINEKLKAQQNMRQPTLQLPFPRATLRRGREVLLYRTRGRRYLVPQSRPPQGRLSQLQRGRGTARGVWRGAARAGRESGRTGRRLDARSFPAAP